MIFHCDLSLADSYFYAEACLLQSKTSYDIFAIWLSFGDTKSKRCKAVLKCKTNCDFNMTVISMQLYNYTVIV